MTGLTARHAQYTLAPMAQTTVVRLTGEDLTLEDVWAVAVEGAPAELADDGARKLAPPRELVDRRRTARASTRTASTPASAASSRSRSRRSRPRSSSSASCAATRAASASRTRDEVVRAAMLLRANALAKGYSGARVETVELLLACLNRGVLPLVPSRGLGRRERRPRAARAPRAAARRRGRGVRRRRAARRAPTRSPRRASSRSGSQAKEGLSLVNGTQFMAAIGRARARPRAPARDGGRRRLRAVARGAPGLARRASCRQIHALRPLRGQRRRPRTSVRLLEGSAIIESHRWCDKVQDAYSLRCAPQVHGAARDLLDYVERRRRGRAERGDRQPARPRRRRAMLVSNGNFHGQPLAFALDSLAMARRRAREHLRAPHRAARQPDPVRTGCRRSSRRRRPQLRVHDPAVRGRLARQREQGARAIRRASTRSRRAPARRITCRWGTRRAEGLAGARERRARARDRAARRRAGGRVPRAARAGAGVARARARLRRVALAAARSRTDRSLSGDIEAGAPAARSATASLARRGRATRSERSHERGRRLASTRLVEALCGDLVASIRAPRGTELNARSWQTEAPLRMLLNNLDPEVAEHPEELVVYGGSGKAARNHDALQRDRPHAARARRRRDAARAERQAGRRLPHASGGAARADRELAARPALGDLGRVPPARGARA